MDPGVCTSSDLHLPLFFCSPVWLSWIYGCPPQFLTCIVVSLLLSYFCVLPTRIWVRYRNHFCCKPSHQKRIVSILRLLVVPTERQERSRMFRNVYGVLLERWHISIGHSLNTNQDPKLAFFGAFLVLPFYLFRWFWCFVSTIYHLSCLSQKLRSWKHVLHSTSYKKGNCRQFPGILNTAFLPAFTHLAHNSIILRCSATPPGFCCI